MSPLFFFTDPVLRAPTLGCMLMCLASSLVGVIVFLRKRSLVGETLSHASYPGVVLSVLLFSFSEDFLAFGVLVGAFATSLLGFKTIVFLERRMKVSSDAALTFVLSTFFGFAILIASRLQVTHALWYKQAQLFLYGQAATMTDIHVAIYALLACATILFILLVYRHLEAVLFDRDFSMSIDIRTKFISNATLFLLALAIVIGIRSVGVVLMSGMLIAPAVAARQFTHRLSTLFIFAGLFGLISGFLGNYLSVVLPNGEYSLPTGPMILLSAGSLCILSLLFAPQSGLAVRFFRIRRFKTQCQMENALKTLWRFGTRPSPWMCWWLKQRRWVDGNFQLTPLGSKRAERIIRLHRLWEVYLVDYMGQGVEKVHRNAEELEHLMTKELEEELTELLADPKQDPHQQPIPPRTEI